MRRLVGFIVIAVCLLMPAPAGSAEAEGGPVVTGPAAKYYGYATAVVVAQPGSAVNYHNFDIEKHNVVQDPIADGVTNKKKQRWCADFPKGRCPLFWSKLIGMGETPIKGLENIKPGNVYTFYCTLHPGMRGRLLAI